MVLWSPGRDLTEINRPPLSRRDHFTMIRTLARWNALR